MKSCHIAGGHVKTSELRDGATTMGKLGADVAAPSAFGTIWYTGTTVSGSRNLSTANVTRPETGVH